MLRVHALRSPLFGPVDIAVAEGECVAVMGPSGAGKSLLLRAIADLDPNDGEVALNGAERNSMPAYTWRRRVALVPAESGWWADTVGEHFIAGTADPALLEKLGFGAEALDWTVARLSSGERQRLALVRALSIKPSALLLDEPTASLDADATHRVEALVRELLGAGLPILLVTHDPRQAKRLATRTLRIAGGQLTDGRLAGSLGKQPKASGGERDAAP